MDSIRRGDFVVLRPLKFLISIGFLIPALVGAATSDLENARRALREDRLPEALQLYRGISPQDPLWREKLEDLTRYHLRKDKPLEAWRILQLARRTQAENADLNDYERLSVMRAGGCALGLPAGTPQRDLLLEAATYRLQASIFDGQSPTPKSLDEFALAPGITPYLEQIPRAQILKGQGCRFAKLGKKASDLKPSKNSLAELEFRVLLTYLQNEGPGSVERTLVLIRALELADLLQKTSDKEKLNLELKNSKTFQWEDFPDPERRWIFAQLFKAQSLPEIPVEKRAEAQALALRILAAKDSSAAWLAMIDLETLNSRQRQQVLARADQLGDAPEPGWILYQRARLFRDQSDPLAALQILRRILVQQEVPLSPELTGASLDLASEILNEHRVNQRMHGALEAAIPGRLWSSFLQKSLLSSALSGESREFREIQNWMKSSSRQNLGWTGQNVDLLKTMSERDLVSFRRHLNSSNLGPESLFQFSRMIASRLAGEAEMPKGLQGFLDLLSEKLIEKFPTGSARAEEVAGLTQIFASVRLKQVEGHRSVRQGTVRIGSVRWQEDPLKQPSWTLSPPSQMPRRELLYIPDPAQDRGWIFSTAIR